MRRSTTPSWVLPIFSSHSRDFEWCKFPSHRPPSYRWKLRGQLFDHDLMAPSRIDASNDDLQFPITIIISPLTFFISSSINFWEFYHKVWDQNTHTHTVRQAQLPQTMPFSKVVPWRAMTQVIMLKIIFGKNFPVNIIHLTDTFEFAEPSTSVNSPKDTHEW